MPDQPFFAVLDDLPKVTQLGGALQKSALVMDHALLHVAWPGPGLPEDVPPETHEFDQLVLLLSGTMDLTLTLPGGERTYRLGPRPSVLYVPAGVPHRGRLVGDERALVAEVFAPARDDYLPLATHQLEGV